MTQSGHYDPFRCFGLCRYDRLTLASGGADETTGFYPDCLGFGGRVATRDARATYYQNRSNRFSGFSQCRRLLAIGKGSAGGIEGP
jgi:hypothetical protein